MTTTNDPLIGSRYDGRYLVDRRIGNGGMANVYLANDETLGRGVAIKVLHQRYAEDSQFVERFLREASAAARLNHPNIVQVYDRGQSEGSYYIAMEFVDGMTLKDLIRRRGALTEQEVFAYGRQALHALRFAHRNGIVHRDVKPHNMMVDTDGRLKIADFGIARAGSDTGLTEAGSIVGTAQYLSPEQARGLEVSASSDLYSLGVVMFEMSTGRVPFDGDAPVGVALKHVNDPVPSPSRLNASISPAIESIILKAMEKDPARRYGSADEMLADLDLARDGGTTSAMTAVLGGAALGAGATAVTSRVPMSDATTVTPAAARSAYQHTPPEPAWPDVTDEDDEGKKGRRGLLIAALLLLALIAAVAAWALLRSDGDPVPDVVGQPVADARAELTEAGFKPVVSEQVFDEDAPPGEVVSQSPDGGDEAEEGETIELVVSKGTEPVPVPDVVGSARAAALEEIRDAGLTPKVVMAPHDEINAGVVISTSPPAGQEVKPGTPVTLTVSQGPEDTAVPAVLDMDLDAAKAALKEAGFESEVVEERNSPKAAGTVLEQDPAAGTEIEKGETVRLVVASGSNTVPDLDGQSPDAARALVEEAGFVPDPREQDDDSLIAGRDSAVVDDQDPDAGGTKEVGSTISYTVRVPTGEEEAEEPEPDDEDPVDPVPVDPAAGGNNGNGRRER